MSPFSKIVCGAGMLLATTFSSAQAAEPLPDNLKNGEFFIGCQAYTFNRFSTFEAIEKTKQSGAKVMELYPGQTMIKDEPTKIGPGMKPEEVQKLKDKLAAEGIKVLAFGVTTIANNENDARKLFQWAKDMDIRVINTESTGSIDTIEKMVKEFDIKVGYHNHPKKDNDPNYKVWDPNYIKELIKDRDVRIGACADTGHWVRSGIKPIDAIKILEGRIVSSHLKDLHEFTRAGHDMPYGQGVSDIPAILDEYKRQGFLGPISIEYEYNWNNSLPEVTQCVTFVREYKPKVAVPVAAAK